MPLAGIGVLPGRRRDRDRLAMVSAVNCGLHAFLLPSHGCRITMQAPPAIKSGRLELEVEKVRHEQVRWRTR